MLGTIVLISIFIMFAVGWFFYYLSFPYWKRSDFLDRFTWMGIFTLAHQLKNMKEPGKRYAKLCLFFLNFTPVFLIATLLILKFLNLL